MRVDHRRADVLDDGRDLAVGADAGAQHGRVAAGVGVDVLEVLVQAGRQALERREVGIGLGDGLHLVGRVAHDRDVEVALAREVVVEQALRDPGGRRDVVDRDLVEGALAEHLDAQRDELLAAGVGAQAGATGGCHVDATVARWRGWRRGSARPSAQASSPSQTATTTPRTA